MGKSPRKINPRASQYLSVLDEASDLLHRHWSEIILPVSLQLKAALRRVNNHPHVSMVVY